ncbi:hypothetical protein BRAS3809_3240020 [Bradyrhizobium sp. STM 3809]|nr:hypothetical protein BRAS3809_3240020 [Bradyrhizobium sp. STM 3809]
MLRCSGASLSGVIPSGRLLGTVAKPEFGVQRSEIRVKKYYGTTACKKVSEFEDKVLKLGELIR